MTKTLKTLIKVSKHFLNEKRRELVMLEESREQYRRYLTKLDIEYETEKSFIAGKPEKAYTFPQYAEKVKSIKHETNNKIIALGSQIEQLSQQISEAYGEMKKFDIMKQRKEAAERKEELDKAQVNLDEIGGVAHRRKSELIN